MYIRWSLIYVVSYVTLWVKFIYTFYCEELLLYIRWCRGQMCGSSVDDDYTILSTSCYSDFLLQNMHAVHLTRLPNIIFLHLNEVHGQRQISQILGTDFLIHYASGQLHGKILKNLSKLSWGGHLSGTLLMCSYAFI